MTPSPRVDVEWRLTKFEHPFLVVRDRISGLCASVDQRLTVRWFFPFFVNPYVHGEGYVQHERGGFDSLDDALRFAASRVWGEPVSRGATVTTRAAPARRPRHRA